MEPHVENVPAIFLVPEGPVVLAVKVQYLSVLVVPGMAVVGRYLVQYRYGRSGYCTHCTKITSTLILRLHHPQHHLSVEKQSLSVESCRLLRVEEPSSARRYTSSNCNTRTLN